MITTELKDSMLRTVDLDSYDSTLITLVAGIAEWLDHLTLVGRFPCLKPPSDLAESVRRELAISL